MVSRVFFRLFGFWFGGFGGFVCLFCHRRMFASVLPLRKGQNWTLFS